jgi:hypothetical protein
MKKLLLLCIACIPTIIACSQLLDEGYLQFRSTSTFISGRDSLLFSVEDQSDKIPNGSIIRVDWLDENGRLLDYKLIPLTDGKVCGAFANDQISRGPTLLRAYFFENGKPMHTARTIIYIGGKVNALTIPENLQPAIINAPFKKADKTFSVAYFIREKYRSSSIQYQLVNQNGELEIIDGIDRINDSLLRIKDIDFVGRGSIRFFVNAEREFRDYDNFKIESIEPIGSIAWGTDDISKNLMSFVKEQLKKESTWTKKTNGEAQVTQYTKNGLPEVVVSAVRKSRTQEMEERYIQNNLFRNQNSSSVVVVDDPAANANMTMRDYILLKFPVIRWVNGEMQYRTGNVQFYLDENPIDDISAINIRDVAMVRLIKGSIRGLNTAEGEPATVSPSPGSTKKRSSGIGGAIAGNTATVAIYTNKGDTRELELKKKIVALPIIGIEASRCN